MHHEIWDIEHLFGSLDVNIYFLTWSKLEKFDLGQYQNDLHFGTAARTKSNVVWQIKCKRLPEECGINNKETDFKFESQRLHNISL